MAYKQAKESFEIVLREMNSISGVNKAQALKKCENIEREIVQLHHSLESCVEASKKEVKRLQHQLEQLNANEVKLTAQEKQLEAKERDLNADKIKADSKVVNLTAEMNSLKVKISEICLKIEREQSKRELALLALIPVVNIFTLGFALNGLISVLSQEKENLECARSRLEREFGIANEHLKQVSNEVERIKLDKTKISNELSVIRNSIDKIEEEIKKRGRDLTESGNALTRLKVSQNNFALAKKDLFMIRECVNNNIFEKGIFNDLIIQFSDTQQNILPIFCLILSFSFISFYFK